MKWRARQGCNIQTISKRGIGYLSRLPAAVLCGAGGVLANQPRLRHERCRDEAD